MPEVDFMAVCEHVRGEAGTLHMISAGLERVHLPAVPGGFNFGLGIRLTLTRLECEKPHLVEIVFQNEDGKPIGRMNATLNSTYPSNLPPGWPTRAALAMNLGLPIPAYGIYSFELAIDGQSKKSISIVVEKPPTRPALPGA